MATTMNSAPKSTEEFMATNLQAPYGIDPKQVPATYLPPTNAPIQPGVSTIPYGATRQPARDISKEELWKIAHSADLTSLLRQPQVYPQPSRGLPMDPNIPFEDLDLSTLGLPTLRGGRRRDMYRDLSLQDPAAILSGLQNIPDIASKHRSHSPAELDEWPLVDVIIHEELIFIVIDAPGFDLQSYYFEEAEPDVLVMIGQKTLAASFPELTNAPPNIWVFRQRPLGSTFVRKIDLRRYNFNLDPSTLTYANYNGCMVYRGLREQRRRPLQRFHYF